MYWEENLETMNEGALKEMQLKLVNQTLVKAAEAPFYRNISGKKLRTLEEIRELPFTRKQDLRDHFPYGFLRTDLSEAVRLHSSSGTTGNPTVVFHTRADIENWTNQVAGDVYDRRPSGDVFQNTIGTDFHRRLGFHYGARR